MKSKSFLTHFSLLFIPLYVVGVLLTFVYNTLFRDRMDIDLGIALVIAVGLDVFMTWTQNRGGKKET